MDSLRSLSNTLLWLAFAAQPVIAAEEAPGVYFEVSGYFREQFGFFGDFQDQVFEKRLGANFGFKETQERTPLGNEGNTVIDFNASVAVRALNSGDGGSIMVSAEHRGETDHLGGTRFYAYWNHSNVAVDVWVRGPAYTPVTVSYEFHGSSVDNSSAYREPRCSVIGHTLPVAGIKYLVKTVTSTAEREIDGVTYSKLHAHRFLREDSAGPASLRSSSGYWLRSDIGSPTPPLKEEIHCEYTFVCRINPCIRSDDQADRAEGAPKPVRTDTNRACRDCDSVAAERPHAHESDSNLVPIPEVARLDQLLAFPGWPSYSREAEGWVVPVTVWNLATNDFRGPLYVSYQASFPSETSYLSLLPLDALEPDAATATSQVLRSNEVLAARGTVTSLFLFRPKGTGFFQVLFSLPWFSQYGIADRLPAVAYINPDDPRLYSTTVGDHQIVTLYGRKSDDGLPIAVDSMMVRLDDGLDYRIDYQEGLPVRLSDSEKNTLRLNWVSDTQVQCVFTSGDGLDSVVFFYDTEDHDSAALQTPFTASGNLPITTAGRAMPTGRDSALLSPWGLLRQIRRFTNNESAQESGIEASERKRLKIIATVLGCETELDDAIVFAEIIDIPSKTELSTVPLKQTRTGSGVYEATHSVAPVEKLPELDEWCQRFNNLNPKICSAVAASGLTAICITFGIAEPTKLPFIFCSVADIFYGDFCIKLEKCRNLAIKHDSKQRGRLQIVTTAVLPGGGVHKSEAQFVDPEFEGSRNLNFLHEFGDKPRISDPYVEPHKPLAFQSYSVGFQLGCLPEGTEAELSYESTDHLELLPVTKIISGHGDITMFVPAGPGGREDTVTLTLRKEGAPDYVRKTLIVVDPVCLRLEVDD